jgi:hypothetical protein
MEDNEGGEEESEGEVCQLSAFESRKLNLRISESKQREELHREIEWN